MTITCEKCGGDSRVTNCRKSSSLFRRRRACLSCDNRWTTFEISEETLSEVQEIIKLRQQIVEATTKIMKLLGEIK